jgi:hypothetical protein
MTACETVNPVMPPIGTMPADNLDFAWDRPETAATLRAKLAVPASPEWLRTAAWLMREGEQGGAARGVRGGVRNLDLSRTLPLNKPTGQPVIQP